MWDKMSPAEFFTGLLTVMFIGLKLAGFIDWSWWWVFSPIWLPIVVGIGLFLIVGAIALVVNLFTAKGK